MTDEQIIELLSTKVMGWQLHPTYNSLHGWYVPDGDQFRFEARADWNPLSKIQDTWMVLEKIAGRGIELVYNPHHEAWFCSIWCPSVTMEDEDVKRAICLAALRAYTLDEQITVNEDPMRESNP